MVRRRCAERDGAGHRRKLNREINAGLADPKLKARYAELGSAVFPTTPADFGKLFVEETAKWAKVVKFSGAKPE